MKRVFYNLLLLSMVLFISCGNSTQEEPDRIFLITLDTTRADYFDYSLSDNLLTPNFAKLASVGIYFENAFALIPITLPSHASMFYSLSPHRLKIYNNGQAQIISKPSVTQLLNRRGYHTGAVISLGVLKADFGLNKGFDQYIENFEPHLWIKDAESVNHDAFKLIKKIEKYKKDKGEKSFFWIHYSDPHEPYFPPCEDCDFNLFINDKKIFTCRSTELATVKVEVILPPGKNALTLETIIPSVFKNFKNCKVEYIKYRDFSIKDQSPGENPSSQNLEIIPPAYWTSKKYKQQVHYYSSQTHSVMTIVNKSKKEIPVELGFIYSMHVNNTARIEFYKEEIKHMDREFGELIDFLKRNGFYEKSMFIIMGDHGEGLGEYHDHFGHIHYLNTLYNRVPLIVAGTGVRQRGKREDPVSTLNIAPTILDIANIKKPLFMLGQSLLEPLTPKILLLETYSPEAHFDAFSLIDYPWQIIFYPGRMKGKLEFFDLTNDPLGIIDLNNINNGEIKANPKKIKKIKTGLIDSLLKISRFITATKGKTGKYSERHKEILKSLGYL